MNYLKKYEVPNFPNNSILKNIYVLDFCSEEDCNNIIKSAELSATFHKGWRTKRHGKYPTTDIPFSYLYQNKNNNWKQWLTNKVKEKIIPILNQYYNCTLIDFHDLFIKSFECQPKKMLPGIYYRLKHFSLRINRKYREPYG